MRGLGQLVLVGLVVLGWPCLGWAADSEGSGRIAVAGPPARPCALTEAQFEALSAIECQPQHAAVLDTRASYTSEREARMDATRTANNILTASWYVGFPGAILAILVAAAPL